MPIYGFIVGQGIRAAREVSARELIERQPDAGRIDIEAPITALAIEPDEIVNVSSLIEGWGSQPGKRRLARLAERRIGFDKRVRASLEDLDGVQRLGLVDSLASPLGANALADGIGAVLPHSGGGGFNGAGYFRSSPIWLWDSTSNRVVMVGPGEMGVEVDGLPLERASTNLVLYSAFSSGLTGWTSAGAGVNGSAIATDTNLLLFDPAAASGLPFSIKFTAGSPHAAALTLSQVTASIVANSFLSLAVDHLALSGVPLSYYLQRIFDGLYWNGAAFAAGPIYNALSLRTQVQRRPEVIGPIPTGANASTFTLGFGFPSGGTASRAAHLFHAQLERAKWSSSRMVSFATAAVREEADYCYANEAGRRSFPATRGTLILRFTPNFSTAKMDGENFYVFGVRYDATNDVTVRFDGINATKDRILTRRFAGGVLVTAAAPIVVTEDAPMCIAFRWDSDSDGELDDLYGAAAAGQSHWDVWGGPPGAVVNLANGVSSIPVESADSRLQIGGLSGECLEGRVSWVRLFPKVLSDKEVQRWCT